MSLLTIPLIFASLAQAPQTPPPPIPADTEIHTTPSGLKYSVLTPGKGGRRAARGDVATVHFTGWLPDGTMFESSRTRGAPLETPVNVGNVTKGWDEALCMMTPGERMKLTIPPELAYQERGRPPVIPPNATLIFEVELLDVKFVGPEFHPAQPDRQKTLPSGIVYEMLDEGEGPMFDPAYRFEAKYALWNTDGQLVDASELGRPWKFKLDSFQLAFGKEVFPLMRVGSRYRFEIPPALAFGAKAADALLPPNSVTVWEIELVRQFEPLPIPQFALSPDNRALKTKTGLLYEVLREGSGPVPRMGNMVTIHFAGWTTDGKLFQASFPDGEPVSFPMRPNTSLPGWLEGLQLMKEGGLYRFTLPPELAFGKRGKPPEVGPDQPVVFVIELLQVDG